MEVASQCPQVFVVDSQASAPQPPVLTPRRGSGMAWRLLWLLVALALLGMLVEAFFIYHLYRMPSGDSGSISALKADPGEKEIEIPSLKKTRTAVKPSKPSAHLIGRPLDRAFSWGEYGDAFVHGMGVRNNELLVQTEGYYFIYSKVHFSEVNCSIFKHMVLQRTQRYAGTIELMKAKNFHCQGRKSEGMHNSYLGGIFHLHTNDSITVKVEKPSQIRLQETADNFFGAYMI